MGRNPVAFYFHILFVEQCEDAERATREPLAECTVAHVSIKRFAPYAIPDRSAHTAALMDFGHRTSPMLCSIFASNAGSPQQSQLAQWVSDARYWRKSTCGLAGCLSGRNFRFGSRADETTVRPNFCFGRKAEVRSCNTDAGSWLGTEVLAVQNNFRCYLSFRHSTQDFRCWSESGRCRKALPTDKIDPEPSFTSEPKRSAFRPACVKTLDQ